MQVALPVNPASPAGRPADSDDLSPPISPAGDFSHPVLRPREFDRGIAARAALKAGVLGGVVGLITPLLGVIVAGMFAVFFYRREKGASPAPRLGSRVGAAAGVVSFAIDYLLVVISILASHAQQQSIDKVLEMEKALGFNTSDPNFQSGVHLIFTPAGLVLSFLFGMILAAALAALCGGLAALFFRPASRS